MSIRFNYCLSEPKKLSKSESRRRIAKAMKENLRKMRLLDRAHQETKGSKLVFA